MEKENKPLSDKCFKHLLDMIDLQIFTKKDLIRLTMLLTYDIESFGHSRDLIEDYCKEIIEVEEYKREFLNINKMEDVIYLTNEEKSLILKYIVYQYCVFGKVVIWGSEKNDIPELSVIKDEKGEICSLGVPFEKQKQIVKWLDIGYGWKDGVNRGYAFERYLDKYGQDRGLEIIIKNVKRK